MIKPCAPAGSWPDACACGRGIYSNLPADAPATPPPRQPAGQKKPAEDTREAPLLNQESAQPAPGAATPAGKEGAPYQPPVAVAAATPPPAAAEVSASPPAAEEAAAAAEAASEQLAEAVSKAQSSRQQSPSGSKHSTPDKSRSEGASSSDKAEAPAEKAPELAEVCFHGRVLTF